MMAVARPAALGQWLFIVFSFACLAWSFLHDDFSVLYVANHSQLALPDIYKFSAVWGAHEGSLLLWVLILSSWTIAVGRYSQELPQKFVARVLGRNDIPWNGRIRRLCLEFISIDVCGHGHYGPAGTSLASQVIA